MFCISINMETSNMLSATNYGLSCFNLIWLLVIISFPSSTHGKKWPSFPLSPNLCSHMLNVVTCWIFTLCYLDSSFLLNYLGPRHRYGDLTFNDHPNIWKNLEKTDTCVGYIPVSDIHTQVQVT